jgi:glucose uptake protein
MLELTYALITITAWGTWIGLSYTAKESRNEVKTFYVTIGNLIFAGCAVLTQPATKAVVLSWTGFWAPLVGGVLWAAGSLFGFLGTSRIGLARAAGIWTPLNIGMGFVWGVLLFGEFAHAGAGGLALLGVSLALIIVGLLLISRARYEAGVLPRRRLLGGLAAAALTGVLWGSYFVPAQAAKTSAWSANFPLALGMLIGGTILTLVRRQKPTLPRSRDYLILPACGAVWGIGNLAMLLMVGLIGTAKGFTIAQLSLPVNALVGIYFFHEPKPRSRAATITLTGIAIAGIGGVLLGNLR